ncbi:MAG: DMT family transporter [Motiliproteus sp.]
MKTLSLRSDLLLLITAAIWGFAFVAQRIGMDHMGPFTFNGIRFLLGATALIPLIYLIKPKLPARLIPVENPRRMMIIGGISTGVVLFIGASLQQMGMVYTNAGNAGFITGLYIVIVPFLGIFLGQRTLANTWAGAIIALAGLYLLSVKDDFSLDYGDLLILISAFFWAGHVLLVGWLSPRLNAIDLSIWQFLICGILSLTTALIVETISWQAILDTAIPLLYAGVMSTSVAFTLQVVAQRHAPPAHAAIILSLEGVFALIGGWLLLGEQMSDKGLWGCGLMLAGMLTSQLPWQKIRPSNRKQKTSAV